MELVAILVIGSYVLAFVRLVRSPRPAMRSQQPDPRESWERAVWRV